MTNTEKKCRVCKQVILWEQICGTRVVRDFKKPSGANCFAYSTRCGCGEVLRNDAGHKVHIVKAPRRRPVPDLKRETRAWLRMVRRDDMDKGDHPATDVLATIRKLRALLGVVPAPKKKRVACANCSQGQHAHAGKATCQETRCGCQCRRKPKRARGEEMRFPGGNLIGGFFPVNP